MIHSAKPQSVWHLRYALFRFINFESLRTDGLTCVRTYEQTTLVDPRGRPTVPAGSDHCFCTCCPYIRTSVPTFQNKTNFKRKQ